MTSVLVMVNQRKSARNVVAEFVVAKMILIIKSCVTNVMLLTI